MSVLEEEPKRCIQCGEEEASLGQPLCLACWAEQGVPTNWDSIFLFKLNAWSRFRGPKK